MFDLSALKGNQNIKDILKNHAYHAYLIEGGSEDDRNLLTKLISMSFVCSSDVKPCYNCRGCQKYLSDNHPDIVQLDGSINIQQMRQNLENINLLPNDSKMRVYLINNADNLSVEVQNVLLKSLEEPPKFVVFILVAVSASSLLETIRSRCTVLSLFSEKDKYNTEDIQDCIDFCNAILNNSFSIANKLLDFKTRQAQKEFFIKVAELYKEKLSSAVKQKESNNKVEKLNSLCRIFDDILEKTQLNTNINLWNTYTLMRCMNVINSN